MSATRTRTSFAVAYGYPAHMQRTWIVWALPLMDADDYLEWRAEYIRRRGDTDLVWSRLWGWEGLLKPKVRRELAARGERA